MVQERASIRNPACNACLPLTVSNSKVSHIQICDLCCAELQVLSELGMSPAAPSLAMPAPPDYLLVMLDGCVVGAMPAGLADAAVARLRAIKAARLLEEDRLPPTDDVIELEVLAWTRPTPPGGLACRPCPPLPGVLTRFKFCYAADSACYDTMYV